MAKQASDRTQLSEQLKHPAYTPKVVDLPTLVALAGESDDDATYRKIFARVAPAASAVILRNFSSLPSQVRVRLARILTAIAAQIPAAELTDSLIELLEDSEPRVRRYAAIALGKRSGDQIVPALLKLYRKDETPPQRKAVVEALGKLGGHGVIDVLQDAANSHDAELTKTASRALSVLQRDEIRQTTHSEIDAYLSLPVGTKVHLRCRRGLEELLAAEAPPLWKTRIIQPGLVEATVGGPMARLFDVRLAEDFVFPIGSTADKTPEAVAGLFSTKLAREVLLDLTRGPVRYSLRFASGGHKRAQVWELSQNIDAMNIRFINDSRDSLWEILVDDAGASGFQVSAKPRGLADPRFTYRVTDVPAASHPPLAAALAYVACVRVNDVVWDPFAGSATELIERALLGPAKAIIGSDTSEAALKAAASNLKAAGIDHIVLEAADAMTFKPRGLTAIITNPPMGKRVARGELDGVLEKFVARAATLLQPGGRLVWVSPRPQQTLAAAKSAGMKPGRTWVVDMGGFDASLQEFFV